MLPFLVAGDVEVCTRAINWYDSGVVLVVIGSVVSVVAFFDDCAVIADFFHYGNVSISAGSAYARVVVDDGADDGFISDFPALGNPVPSPLGGVAGGVEGDVVGIATGLLDDAPCCEGYTFTGERVGGIGYLRAISVVVGAVGEMFPGVVVA